METENGNRGANVKSTCLEAAESLGRTGKGGFAETGIFRRCLSWGAGEEAAHSHLRVEGLLFHGDLCVMKQWCVEYRCFFFGSHRAERDDMRIKPPQTESSKAESGQEAKVPGLWP